MSIVYHPTLAQGSDEWLAARCGLLTASEMKLLVNIPKVETRVKKNGEPYKQREPTAAENDKERAHLYELLAQRITRYVEPHYIGDEMLRGMDDEVIALALYAERYAPVEKCGFVTNDKWGFTLGYSPDALVIGQPGLVEAKSRRQKFQVETIVAHATTGEIPADFLLQCQSGLLVAADREWLDLISYCGGLPMYVMRVYPDPKIADAIVNAAGEFERRLQARHEEYLSALSDRAEFLTPTEHRIEQEMTV